MSAIGVRVRDLRKARGLSQQALAGDGISAGYVSLIESGKRSPSRDVAERLAARLGVRVDQLLDGEAASVSDDTRVEVNFARLALANGDPSEAIRALSKMDMASFDIGLARDAGLALAQAYREIGQLDLALRVIDALVDRCCRDAAWSSLAVVATLFVGVSLESGDVERSTVVAERALEQIETAGLVGTDEHLRLASAYVSCLYERGDLAHATRRVEELIRIADRLGSTRARGSIYWNAATVAHERGRVADAIRLTDRAVALLGEQESSRDLPRLRMNYAWILLHQESPQPHEALEQLDRAESDPSLIGSQLDRGTAETFRGRAHLLLGEIDAAAEHAAQALQLLGPSDHVEHTSALILLGDVGTAQLNMDLAQEAFTEAERVLSEMTPSRGTARLWRELGDGLRDLGETHRAIAAYDHAFRMMGIAPRPKPLVDLQYGRTNYATR
jgi:transcriptional regulator with XRE-family HTH domain/Tfp pilus assembly protein PilF